jgi:hypothetical protein
VQTAASSPAAGAVRARWTDVDAVRGACLVAIFVYHSLLAHHRLVQLTHPFLFDAALVFVGVSGFMAGHVYGARRADPAGLLRKVGRRVGVIGATHLGLMLCLALALAADHRFGAGADDLRRFFGAPVTAPGDWLGAVLTLRHQPILFDILPIYIVCLALSPALMLASFPWRVALLAGSWGLWLACWKGGWVQRDALSGETIHFALAAWQAVFATGCFVALERARVARWCDRPWLSAVSVAVVAAGVLWVCLPYAASQRSDAFWSATLGRLGMSAAPPPRLEKTTLHPLLMLSFAAAALLWWRHRTWVVRAAGTVPGRLLALLGAHSLPVFACGTLLCIGTAWLRFRLQWGEHPGSNGAGLIAGQVAVAAGLAIQLALAYALEGRRQARRVAPC